MGQDLFADFDRFGDRVWAELEHGERSAQRFKYLVGVISRALVDTHRIVLKRLAAIGEAGTVGDAKRELEGIRVDELSEAFRVEGLCDTLGGLGEGLLRRTSDARYEGIFTDAELAGAETFAGMLADREYEAARAYANALSEVTELGYQLDETSLPALKERVAELERTMTNQVSDFRAKAERFMSVGG